MLCDVCNEQSSKGKSFYTCGSIQPGLEAEKIKKINEKKHPELSPSPSRSLTRSFNKDKQDVLVNLRHNDSDS